MAGKNPFLPPPTDEVAGQDPFAVLDAMASPPATGFAQQAAGALTNKAEEKRASQAEVLADQSTGYKPTPFIAKERPTFKKGLLKNVDKQMFFAGLSDAVLQLSGQAPRFTEMAAAERQAFEDREAQRRQLHENQEIRRIERVENRKDELSDEERRRAYEERREAERTAAREAREDRLLAAETDAERMKGEQDFRRRMVGTAFESLSRYYDGADFPARFQDVEAIADNPQIFKEFMSWTGKMRSNAIINERLNNEATKKLAKDQQDALADIRSRSQLFSRGFLPADPEDADNPNPGYVPLPGTSPDMLETVDSKADRVVMAGVDVADPVDIQAGLGEFVNAYIDGFEMLNSKAIGQLGDDALWANERQELIGQAVQAYDAAVQRKQALMNQPAPAQRKPGFLAGLGKSVGSIGPTLVDNWYNPQPGDNQRPDPEQVLSGVVTRIDAIYERSPQQAAKVLRTSGQDVRRRYAAQNPDRYAELMGKTAK